MHVLRFKPSFRIYEGFCFENREFLHKNREGFVLKSDKPNPTLVLHVLFFIKENMRKERREKKREKRKGRKEKKKRQKKKKKKERKEKKRNQERGVVVRV